MEIKKTVIVTALFDIGRDKWDSYGLSYHTYCWWMRSLLCLDTTMIIYTEDRFNEEIIKYRKEVDPLLENTTIILQSINELDAYKIFYTPLKTLMESNDFNKLIQFKVPEMTKPLYNVVNFSKLFYILDSYRKNIYDADLYIWADAGVIREDNPYKNKKWPNLDLINKLDNTNVTFFCHHDYVSVMDYKSHTLSQSRFIQGGSFFIPKQCVESVCDRFKTIALECIQNGYIGSDEKVLDFVYLDNPTSFNLIKCGWREYIDLFI